MVLKSDIQRDIGKLESIFSKFHTSYSRFTHEKIYAYLVESAFHVNQIYTGFERMFKNIATAFENSIDETSGHKSLLDRMIIGINGIRPTVISEAGYNYLNELRAFRHFFRHAYDFDLEAEKFAIVASKTIALEKIYKNDIQTFTTFIDELIKS
jgi:hypothetical protein